MQPTDANDLPRMGEPVYPETMTELPHKKPKPRINFELPDHVLEQVRDRALSQGLTLTGYMLKLIADDGLDVTAKPAIDGRTLRGKLRRSA